MIAEPVDAMGIGTPGPLDIDTGVLISSANLKTSRMLNSFLS